MKDHHPLYDQNSSAHEPISGARSKPPIFVSESTTASELTLIVNKIVQASDTILRADGIDKHTVKKKAVIKRIGSLIVEFIQDSFVVVFEKDGETVETYVTSRVKNARRRLSNGNGLQGAEMMKDEASAIGHIVDVSGHVTDVSVGGTGESASLMDYLHELGGEHGSISRYYDSKISDDYLSDLFGWDETEW